MVGSNSRSSSTVSLQDANGRIDEELLYGDSKVSFSTTTQSKSPARSRPRRRRAAEIAQRAHQQQVQERLAATEFARIYDDGDMHRVDLEAARRGSWDTDVSPLRRQLAAEPGKAWAGDRSYQRAEQYVSAAANRLAGKKNKSHIAYYDNIEQGRFLEAAGQSVLGDATASLFKYRYTFDITRPVPVLTQGNVHVEMDVQRLYLLLLQKFAGKRLLPASWQRPDRTPAELVWNSGQEDVLSNPLTMIQLLYNCHVFLQRFWQRIVRTGDGIGCMAHSHQAVQLFDLRRGTLDRALDIPTDVYDTVQSHLEAAPDRVDFIDRILFHLGYHTRTAATNRLGLIRSVSKEQYGQNLEDERTVKQLVAAAKKAEARKLAHLDPVLRKLWEDWWAVHGGARPWPADVTSFVLGAQLEDESSMMASTHHEANETELHARKLASHVFAEMDKREAQWFEGPDGPYLPHVSVLRTAPVSMTSKLVKLWPAEAVDVLQHLSPPEGQWKCTHRRCSWRFYTLADMKAHFRRCHFHPLPESETFHKKEDGSYMLVPSMRPPPGPHAVTSVLQQLQGSKLGLTTSLRPRVVTSAAATESEPDTEPSSES